MDGSLSGYERESFAHDGKTRDVFRRGEGPAVVVMAEVPGITPKVLEFAERVVRIGCTAVVPHLFGVPGADPLNKGRFRATRAALSVMAPACVSREFLIFATGRTSPVVDWLRALARAEHERCGGRGVGAVGMCFTGGYALAMATDERLLASVLSQPGWPVPVGKRRANTIDISDEDLAVVRTRCAARDLEVLGLRFTTDPSVPAERFEFLRRELGDAFVGVELPPETANPDALVWPHSVLTEHLIDEAGEPTRDALDQVLDLLRRRLLPTN